jgi:hypothetical protein
MRMSDVPHFPLGQANFLLTRAVAEGKIRTNDITRYQHEMKTEINDLETRLNGLREAVGVTSATEVKTKGNGHAKMAEPVTRRRHRITPEQLASRQLQGRYLGLIRQIPATKRGKFQKLAKDKGREAAIKALHSVLG